ncbi:ATP phosphoribosyltransferase [Microbacterium sp.]|uniref:ATP phosphoribosyltransferase n=1 Tax=Microbacterium sp. TaxID=51671 RepID=UPI003562813E
MFVQLDTDAFHATPRGGLSRTRFGVPNQGRLLSQTRAALAWPEWTEESRKMVFTTPEVEILLARSTDLPRMLAAGIVDGCVTGRDYVIEAGVEDEVEEIIDLGFQATNLCVLAAAESVTEENDALEPVVVVSQYPAIASRWIGGGLGQGKRRRATLVPIDGAAEMYVTSGLARYAVDAVMTGRTLRDNGLAVVETLFASAGCVYSRGREHLDRDKIETLATLGRQLFAEGQR